MKIIICQIAIVVLLIVQLNNAAQAQLSRIILPQDSITFKKINIAFVNLKTHINNELPDTSKIDFNIKLIAANKQKQILYLSGPYYYTK
jgi:hypothetical protein